MLRRKRINIGKKPWRKEDRGLFRFDPHTRKLEVRNLKGEIILDGKMGVHIASSYSNPEESTLDGLHYTWGGHIFQSMIKGDKNCITVDWDSISDETFTPMDCFNLGKHSWYGGGQLNMPNWPVNKASIPMLPFYAKVYNNTHQHFTSVLEPYWLSSSGVAIYVDEIVPLHVSINEKSNGMLCLKASAEGYPNYPHPIHLKYRMCFGNNMELTHKFMTSRYFDKPSQPFSSSLTRYPFCAMTSPSQAKLTRFYKSILIRQFACGHIDLGFQEGLEFNKKDFPNPISLIKDIHSRNLKVSVTVDSVLGRIEAVPKNFILLSKRKKYSLNLSNHTARNWLIDKISNFKTEFEIDTMRFCCGQLDYPIIEYKLGGRNPGIIIQNYANALSSISKSTEILVGYKTQSLPLIIRIADRKPEWGKENGLRSIIPMVLSIGVIGYPFVTIGPIGGKLDKDPEKAMVEKELFIRWMQLSVFFPVIDFQTYPWEYDDNDVIQASADILDLRYSLWDNILVIAKDGVSAGLPIVRPMWWLVPEDRMTYDLSAQFMLGNIYLVAPVLWPGAKVHEVYLPKGVWREMFGKGLKHEIEVGQWITFDVDLKTIVYFECLICKT
ncbi:myogenesis-regulating glycosidase-like [Xenia sp. Carnegie-2017]|uniref:myogenesis-regulating glycosidase-like n=1 Tax=Xenia sp. Carnegie-2017 TaxID=2897299 RepID=UPI001F04F9CB|nr:myogenesis-regulating glycosidase-like [Xenia sp. Carnegie-2017]